MMNLSTEVGAALLVRDGVLGATLACVLAYEQGNWEGVHGLNLSEATLREVYLDALGWGRAILPLMEA